MLPDLNGLDLLQQIRSDQRTAHLPVVVVSVTSPHGLGAITGDSIVDWIGKPLDARRFLDTVVQAVLIGNVSKGV
jgi:CheY-like chemotaxis protein